MCTCLAHDFAPFKVIYKQDPILPGTLLTDETFPSSMNILSNDVASLEEHLIAAFKAARDNIAAVLLHQDVKAKKHYDNVHQ